MKNLLLISNSYSYGRQYLDHCEVYPRSFEALNLINFQVNAHYIDADPSSTHKGETREQRFADYFLDNEIPILGLYEDSWLRVENEQVILEGKPAKLFQKDKEPITLSQGQIQIPT